ncbi:MAG: right-handed parallel beta-helix repeat-containing protein, partial [Planctomycetota bacterium]|nr:right-handed parallel beta-helix repeat-containing protein [Planctomycetota bacterium]
GHGLRTGSDAGVGLVKNSRANSNSLSGFYCRTTPNSSYIDCTAEGNRKNGFHILYTSKVSFVRCESTFNGNDGFLVQEGASGTLTSCKAFNNKSSGIVALSKKARILAKNCEASRNKYGFFITYNSEMTGTGLTARDNSANGLVVQEKSLAKIFQSTITSNKAHNLCLVRGSELIVESSSFDKEGPLFLYKDKDSKITIKGD